MNLVDDEHFVQTFFADSAHPQLYEGLAIGRLNGSVNDFDLLGLENGVDGGGEFHIVFMDQKADARIALLEFLHCTLGIDEAERYHNPRDPATQQIRQLLNSGYKAGMPALRVVGDDFKPQTFDVYSPKLLASIAGLEEVLASRCITVTMRQTARRLPVFPASFDGARLRHQLYSLALMHFQEIHHRYTEQLLQQTSNNRLGELWSPLFALARFVEAVGGIDCLHEVTAAAETSTQSSQK